MRLWWRLALLGLVGSTSIALVPFERVMPVAMDPLALRLVAVVQPSILVLLAVTLGLWAAPKVGLDAPVVRAWAQGRPLLPAMRGQWLPAVAGGLVVGTLLVGFWSYIRLQPAASALQGFDMPLTTKLLYGGIAEELLLRWGMMSLFVWILWRFAGAPEKVPAWCLRIGLLAAALLFAVGHLPALHLLIADPPASLVAVVIGANAVAGAIFGWLYWRRGLEAAMLAHALAHLFGTAAVSVIEGYFIA